MASFKSLIGPVLFAGIIMLCGCGSGYIPDSRLAEAARLAPDSPMLALRILDDIDCSSLAERDRHYFDFLSIKAKDKAYIRHTSDSLIRNVIDWYSRHNDLGLYPEALYYGGRVCSDIGDSPSALNYFQQSLDLIPDNKDYAPLKSTVLNQTGRLLSNLLLYDQAIPYLKKSLEIDYSLNDSTNLPYAHQLLGLAYRDSKDYASAISHLKRACELSENMSDKDKAFMQGSLAAVMYDKGIIDSALMHIRTTPERVFDEDKDYFKAQAAQIYCHAGILDTAFMYAAQLKSSRNLNYRASGYKVLLAPELRKYLPQDSLYHYFNRYRQIISDITNEHNAQAAIMQNSFYNYSLIERRNAALSEGRMKLYFWLCIALFFIMALTAASYILYRRNRQRKRSLAKALQRIREINRQQRDDSGNSHPDDSFDSASVKEMKNRIIHEITHIKMEVQEADSRQNDASDTAGYRLIVAALEDGRTLSDDDPAWEDAMEAVREISPGFEATLTRLSADSLSPQDMQIAVLIRLGFQPAQIARIQGRAKGAISYRRNLLCKKIFYEQIDLKDLDSIIRSL